MVTEVTHQSWGSRLMDSLKNIVFGIVVFGLGIWLLWWNEKNAVTKYREVNDVRNNIETVSAESISPVNEGKPIHVTGKAVTEDVLVDEKFEVEANAIRLRRKVEMYQWNQLEKKHQRKKVGGGTETVTDYSYEKIWADHVISSSNFKEPERVNPEVMQPSGDSYVADKVMLGSFTLGHDAVVQMNAYEPLTIHRAKLPDGARLEGSTIYYSKDIGAPEIGDVRVSFQVVPQGEVSIIAAQKGAELRSWKTPRGGNYLRLQTGTHTAEEMLDQAESEIRMMTLLLRAGGWLLMSFGLITVMTPLSVLGDIIPFIGNLIGGGIKIFSLLVCGVLALLIIGLAWLAARPLVGIPVLAASGGLVFWLVLRARKTKAKTASAKAATA